MNTTHSAIVSNSRDEYAMNLVFIHLSNVDFGNLIKCKLIVKISVMSPVNINIKTRALLVGETKITKFFFNACLSSI